MVEGPAGDGVEARFDFAAAGATAAGPAPDGALGWQLDPTGSPRLAVDGLHASFAGSSSRLVSPPLALPASMRAYLAVEATAPASTDGRGILDAVIEFATADANGVCRRPFRFGPEREAAT